MKLLNTLGTGLTLAVLSAPAFAQTEALTLAAMSVTRFDTLPNIDTDMASPCCATHIYESGSDHDFIYINLDFTVAWNDDLDRVSIRAGDIGLQLATETDARQAWGRVDSLPEIERGAPSLSARRPRDFPEETAGAYYDAMFLVPAGATEATLTIGEGASAIQIPIDLNQPLSEMPSAASFYDIKINAISTTSELTTEDRLSREEVMGRITAMEGTNIVRVEVEVVPSANLRQNNEVGENQVFFRNTAFGLVGPEGLPLLPIGRSVGDSLRNNYSNSANWDGDEAGPTIDLTLFFLGSGAPGDYRLFFYDRQVGGAPLQ
ncbi:hypothetical protein [Hasllibacter sp. MH4015]|uniref:hypothetical protein n=1 Tax=Hasllibacter sp. MH4015 TaxID=2854029 RepID=UPI001CD64BEC|nr:hypothetical protein [Hasllibacter sp. MH4015]